MISAGELRKVVATGLCSCSLWAALAGCGLPAGLTGSPAKPPRAVPITPGNFFGLAWLRDGTLVVGYAESGQSKDEVRKVSVDGTGFEKLPLPDDPLCTFTEYKFPTALSDGRVALTKGCRHLDGGAPRFEDFGVAYDLASKKLEVLTPSLKQSLWSISWDRTIQHAVAADGSGIVESIFAIDRRGTHLFLTRIQEGDKSFRLDDYFHDSPTDDGAVAREGLALTPAFSPDGRWIAFAGDATVVGQSGSGRLDGLRSMYVMDGSGGHLKKLFDGVAGDAGQIAWSPDGKRIAYEDHQATLVYDVAQQKAWRIASVALRWLAWSPDGNSVAGIRSLDSDGTRYDIAIADAKSPS